MTSSTGASSYHHGNLRQALIEAGLAELKSVGPDQLSLRALARASGVSQTAPYRHFADKQALLAVLAAEGFRRLKERTETAMAISPDAQDALVKAGHAYVQFAIEEPALYRLMFGPMLTAADSDEMAQAGQQSFYALVEIARRGISEGRFVDEDPVRVARVAWSLVHGVSTLMLDNRFSTTGSDAMKMVDETLQLALKGLLRR